MKTYRYTGLFIDHEGNNYTIVVGCNGVMQAFFLLIADAIRKGKSYQLNTITDEKGSVTYVGDILRVKELLN